MKKIRLLILLIGLLFLFIIKIKPHLKEEMVFSKIYDYSSCSIVMEMNKNKILHQNNIHQKMLPASITKILTCITTILYMDLNKLVVVENKMLKEVYGSSIYLEVGDIISVNDLLYGLMLNSGNDAAEVIAYSYSGIKEDFIYLMNLVAKNIGMKNSVFRNPHGLDSINQNFTTAYDMAILMSYAMKNETFRKITQTQSYFPIIASGKKLYLKNKHKLIQKLDYVTGGKTGFTNKARRTLVTTFQKNQIELVVVTFNCNNDFEFHQNIADYYLNQYE